MRILVSIEDFVEIDQVASWFMHLVDTKQWSRLSEVYAENAIYDGSQTSTGATAEGVSAIAELYASVRMGVHFCTNVVILEGGSGSARTISKWMSWQYTGRLNTGEYTDDWVKTADGWRIQRRVNTIRHPDPESK
jgi:hypothetical protein